MLNYVFTVLIITVLSLLLGLFLTEDKNYSLPQLLPILDRKPFNCRPCLTFHLQVLMYIFAAYINHSFGLWCVGVIISFFVFWALYIKSKSNIED